MVRNSIVLWRNVSNKIWNTTIKIPELKTTLPAMESLFDQEQVAHVLTDLVKEHKGKVLVITGAGK